MAAESILNGPIPGQSLTTEPGNFAWEQPPETEQPEEALLYHVSKMADGKFIEPVTMLMQLDIPIEAITNTLLTKAVGEGIHSIDVGLIIAPSVHKELVSLAEETDTPYIEFFSDDAEKEQRQKENLKTLVMHNIKKMSREDTPPLISQTAAALSSPAVEDFEDQRDAQEGEPLEDDAMAQDVDAMPEGEMPLEEEQEVAAPETEQGMGLMSRGA